MQELVTEPHWASLLSQAQSLVQAGRWDAATPCYRAVLAQNPDQLDALEGLGLAALHAQQTGEALRWLERARQRAPANARVLCNLGIALRRNGQLGEAIAVYQRAFALEPRPTILLNLGRAERDAGRLVEAIQAFERALELDRKAPEVWSLLSNALREAGRFDEAVQAGRQAVTLNPWLGDGHVNLGAALHQLGQLDEAVVQYWVATALPASRDAALANLRVAWADPRLRQSMAPGSTPPSPVGAPLKLGTDLGREARVLVTRLVAAPEDAAAMLELGRLLHQMQRHPAAILCVERAVQLCPSARGHREHAAVLWGLGYFAQAEERLLRAVECDPSDLQSYRQLGAWLSAQCKLSLGGERFQAALAGCPDDVVSLVNLGAALQGQGRPSEAVRLQRRALELQPNLIEAHLNLGAALSDQGAFAEANAACRRALSLDPTRWGVVSNLLFALHFDPALTPDAIFSEHLAYARRFGDPLRATAGKHSHDRDPQRRLRVGYISPDLRQHPVAYFLEPVLAAHDRDSVEVYCYSDVERPDAVTQRLRDMVPRFIDCAGLSDAALAERIVADQVDVLVDLAGHTGKNRLLVFARSPSPVQVSWLGYFDTTGFASIDYRIADAHSIPPEAERFFVEQVVRLPRSSNCFLPPRSPEPVAPPCLARGHITFGCFNNPAKVTRDVVRVFARILHEVPGSRLVLKYGAFTDPTLRERYLAWLAEAGITSERVSILGHSSLEQYFVAFGEIDIALDPFPYSGETTALHGLWMGVPVVALEGETLVQRLASRVLRVAGLDGWVARSEQDYVQIATSLARDLDALKRLRLALREELKVSPLLDHAGVTRDLEAAYRKMWQTWCGRSDGNRGSASPLTRR